MVHSLYEAATVPVFSGVGLNRFRGWGGGGMTLETLNLRGCHCPDYLGWD